jgi:hypothetical protein
MLDYSVVQQRVRWWPFDGLDISSLEYAGKHVGVEIYPSALRPEDVPQTDRNDAIYSCLYARDADVTGCLANRMNLMGIREQDRPRILKEGWIVGMRPPNA